jgi:hypothetical protein
MKNRKIEREYEYQGLGFPVVLQMVPMVEIRGVWTPEIDYNSLQRVVLLALAYYPSALTGHHIRFIRSWLELTQSAFGDLLGVTHTAVVKWEKAEERSARIILTTEREIRMIILDHLLKKAEDFRQAYRVIHKLDFSQEPEPIEINTQRDLIAI